MKMNKKGFTLIEMLVVVAILAILVAIVIPVVGNANEKAKEAKDAANIRSAIAECTIARLTGEGDTSKEVILTQKDSFDKLGSDLSNIGGWEPNPASGTKFSGTGAHIVSVDENGNVTVTPKT
ncbi:MAG: type II secretion system GspH family protein [Oscillospiraceae bacterium]|nr:type II secretion system GspH family protein [Oscillospiraceae bacterium]